ncbi:MAG TPA: hypothetical protein DD458_04650, partial [Prolixibacteraceae bacterium]|nr:hypothetical protein [Prolixibacteraceae bacterium]HCR91238.1 hypothetical protein [Prolixibacteraceae bacterium]
MKILDNSIDDLVVLLDEVTRANPDGKRFIEPSIGVLKQAKSRRHHVIFGRRGSGKSSLLRKTKNEIESESESLGIYIDVESLNENQYPDILILVLIEILKELRHKTKKQFIFFQKVGLKNKIKQTLKQFNSLLYSEDFAQLEKRTKSLNTRNSTIDLMISASSKIKIGERSLKEDENKEVFTRSKINILNRNISNLFGVS